MSGDLVRDIFSLVADGLLRRRMSLADFCATYLRHHFALPPSLFHKEFIADLDAMVDLRGQREVRCAPRGNAKSTIMSLALPLYCIVYGLERYIVQVSDTHAQSVQFLSDVKLELEQNELLKRDFPHATGKGIKWATEEIITKNNIMITALGMRGKIRGRKFGNWRPTLIIIDDPENDESVISPRQRERTMTWLMKGAVAAGVPGHTNIIIVGTVINADCMVENLRSLPGWGSKVYRSIIEWPERMDLWEQWEQLVYDEINDEDKKLARTFYEGQKAEMDKGAVVLWPEREDLYSLMLLRCEIGHLAFESEKQNASVNPAQCRFPNDWFDDIWYEELPKFPGDEKHTERLWHAYGACDPSLGKDGKKGDYAPIITIHWRQGHGTLYVDCDMQRRPPTATIDKILDIDVRVLFEAFGFETNGFQAVMAADLQTKLIAAGRTFPVILINHTQPKQLRIERLAVLLQQGKLKFRKNSPGVKLLIKQLMMFPIGDHDDGPDALEMAIEIVRHGSARKLKRGGGRR